MICFRLWGSSCSCFRWQQAWAEKPAPICHQPSRLTAPDHTLGLSLRYTHTQAWSCLPPALHHTGDWHLPVSVWEMCRSPVHGPGWLSLTYIQTFKATRKLLSFIFIFSPECGSLNNTESETQVVWIREGYIGLSFLFVNCPWADLYINMCVHTYI